MKCLETFAHKILVHSYKELLVIRACDWQHSKWIRRRNSCRVSHEVPAVSTVYQSFAVQFGHLRDPLIGLVPTARSASANDDVISRRYVRTHAWRGARPEVLRRSDARSPWVAPVRSGLRRQSTECLWVITTANHCRSDNSIQKVRVRRMTDSLTLTAAYMYSCPSASGTLRPGATQSRQCTITT